MGAESAIAAAPATLTEGRTDRVARLFDTHQAALYRLARRLTNGPDDARDLVQDTFLRAAKASSRIPAGRPQEEAWLVRVLINIQRDEWRRRDVRARSHRVEGARADTVAPTQESQCIARHEIWRALDTLHPRRRAVIVLHELDGHSVAAIAALLGVTAITVRWHLSRGRRDLRRILCAHMEGVDEDRT